MCFHLIPDIKVVHQGGVVFSESIVMTERGHELLTDYPQEIFLAVLLGSVLVARRLGGIA